MRRAMRSPSLRSRPRSRKAPLPRRTNVQWCPDPARLSILHEGLMGQSAAAAAQDPRPRVIVVGGGFAGLAAVKALREEPGPGLPIAPAHQPLFPAAPPP